MGRVDDRPGRRVLVNNAGIHLHLRSKGQEAHLVDGHEVHWRTNYLGTAKLHERGHNA